MQEAAAFTPEEQKYFDTKGADGPADDGTPVTPAPEPVAAPEAAKQPEQAPATDPDEQDNPGKFVRHGAFHEERERRKQLQQELQAERLRNAEINARLEERLAMLARHVEPQQPQQPQDPIQTIQELQQWKQQTEAERQQQWQAQQQYEALRTAVETAETEFSKAQPDYYEAINFARQARDRELQLFGVNDPRERNAILEDTITRVSALALQRGESPAEMFYKYALERGFKAQAPQPPAQQQQAKPNAAEKLAKIAEGQQVGKSLGAANGMATPQLTLESLANMSDDEFAKVALNKKEWRKLMGG